VGFSPLNLACACRSPTYQGERINLSSGPSLSLCLLDFPIPKEFLQRPFGFERFGYISFKGQWHCIRERCQTPVLEQKCRTLPSDLAKFPRDPGQDCAKSPPTGSLSDCGFKILTKPSRLRKNYMGTPELHESARLGQPRSVWFIWFLWSVWSVSSLLFIAPDRPNRPDRPDRLNQPSAPSLLTPHPLPPPSAICHLLSTLQIQP